MIHKIFEKIHNPLFWLFFPLILLHNIFPNFYITYSFALCFIFSRKNLDSEKIFGATHNAFKYQMS